MPPRIDHVGIATKNLEDSSILWNILGLKQGVDEIIPEHDVRVRMFHGTDNNLNETFSKIELIEPLSDSSPIAKFISNQGEGIQQIAINVQNIEFVIDKLMNNNFTMINSTPNIGANGNLIAFIHPKSTGGILVELVQSQIQ
jgi:methylmalonyl-CoA/ethylmalonyl-CoA epimerase